MRYFFIDSKFNIPEISQRNPGTKGIDILLSSVEPRKVCYLDRNETSQAAISFHAQIISSHSFFCSNIFRLPEVEGYPLVIIVQSCATLFEWMFRPTPVETRELPVARSWVIPKPTQCRCSEEVRAATSRGDIHRENLQQPAFEPLCIKTDCRHTPAAHRRQPLEAEGISA